MKYKRKSYKMRLIAALLLACFTLQYMPSMPSKTAEAADYVNYIGPDHPTGKLRNGDYDLSRYQYLDDGSVIVKTSYNYEPGRRTTYYTVDTIWSKNSSRQGGRKECYPLETGTQGVDWVYTGVGAYNLPVDMFDVVSQSTYTFSKENIHNMLTTLFGELQPNEYYTVYMSEIFIRRERYEDGTFTDYPGKRYYNIDEVRAMAPWTEKTNEQFEAYYDIPLTFMLRGGQITIVYVDEDNGNAIIPGMSRAEKYIFGDDVTVVPELSISVGGKNMNYTGKYGYGFGSVKLDKYGYPETFEMTQSLSGRKVFLGYSASATPPAPVEGTGTIKVVPVDMDNGNTPIESAKKVITYLSGDNVNFDNYIDPTCTKGGETLAYARKYNFSESGSVSLSQSGYPGVRCMGDANDRTTLYIGYKRGIAPPVPSITPSITPTPAPIVTMPPLPTLPPATPTPTPGPNEEVAEVWSSGQKVQIYADDYDSSTGPYNDLQPYLVNDVSDGTKKNSKIIRKKF